MRELFHESSSAVFFSSTSWDRADVSPSIRRRLLLSVCIYIHESQLARSLREDGSPA